MSFLFFLQLEYVWFSSFAAEPEKKIVTLSRCCSIYLNIFIPTSQFNSLAFGTAPSYHFSPLQHNSCNIFNHKSPLSSYSSLHLFLSLSLATTTCNNWLFLPPSILSSLLPPSGNDITPSERSTIEHFPTPIIRTLSHPPFSFSSPAAPFFLLSLYHFYPFPPLILRYTPLHPSLHPAPPKSTTCSGSGRRSSLITNKENPFGAAVCCFSSGPLWTLLRRNAPHLSSFQLSSSSLLSLLDFPFFIIISLLLFLLSVSLSH